MVVHEERVLLPQKLYPTSYDITLTPDLQRFTFTGSCDITVDVRETTKSVSLHARELAVSEAKFTPAQGGDAIPAKRISLDLEATVLELEFGKELPLGAGTLSLTYIGQLNNQMAGFYRSTYTNIKGEAKVMASTQFESIDARRAFPCWDEPAVKAVFKLTLIVPDHMVALSNMPEEEVQSRKDGTKRFTFQPTVKMSTYLLAFAVGEFDFVQSTTKHGVVIRCFSTPGVSDRCNFALDCAVKCLDLYDDFFELPYPLPKLDMLAVPEFAAGAMENWGLVTYREVDLLIDPATATSGQRQRVCTVVTHELAHQWFGNLVTMAWWSGLWLNEGFACFMQTWAADLIFPEWKLWDQFVTDDLTSALRLDSLRSSHPIQVPIKHAEEVEEVFDAISYCKGACVIRMLNAVLGEEAFRKGLQVYMKRHQYGNTETDDLWKAWEEASGKPITDIAASWTEQMGFPVLRVEEAGAGKVTVSQSWFLADGSKVEPSEEKTWALPIFSSSRSTRDKPGSSQIFREKSFEVVVEGAAADDWLQINAGYLVPARVLYSKGLLKKLADGIRAKEVPSMDRAAILLDAHALTNANLMDPADLMHLLSAYTTEDDSIVWDALAMVLAAVDKAVVGIDSAHSNFKKMAAGIVDPAMARLGWEPKDTDSHLTKLMRSTVISLLARFSEDPSLREEARRRFEAVVEDPNDVAACPTDYRVAVFSMVASKGGKKEYDELMTIYKKCDNDAQRKHVLHSIGYISDPKLKEAALDWTTSGAVKLQDFFYIFNSVGSSDKTGQTVVWKYFVANFDRIREMLAKANPSLMHAVIIYSSRHFVTRDRLEEVRAFFQSHPLKGTERVIAQMVESMGVTVAFAERAAQSDMAKDSFWASLGQ